MFPHGVKQSIIIIIIISHLWPPLWRLEFFSANGPPSQGPGGNPFSVPRPSHVYFFSPSGWVAGEDSL